MGRRLDVKITFNCNNYCLFCAQGHKRGIPDPTLKELKSQIRKAREEGYDEIVFTGGEPTFRKELLDLVRYASSLGYKLIQIQTNGRMLKYRDFIRKLMDAGANEFSPSIHGHKPEIHDALTRAPGSFKQVYEGIKNLKSMGAYVITNTVITTLNYKFLPEIADMLIELNVDQLQFAFVHIVGNAWKFRNIIVPRKRDVQPYIMEALRRVKEAGYGPGRAMVEAYPFCLLPGFEKYCSELYIPPAKVIDAGFVVEFHKWRVAEGKVKFEKCKECKFAAICEGPWKEYPELFGDEEFIPVKGEPVTSVDEL